MSVEASSNFFKENLGMENDRFIYRYFHVIASSVAALLGLLYLYFTWHFNYWSKKGYFSLKPTPFFGNFAQVFLSKTSIAEFFADIYLNNPYAEVIGIWILRKPVLVLRNHELIKKVLIKDFDNFRDRTTHVDKDIDPLAFNSLFFIKAPYWKPLRSQLSPLFTGNKIKNLTKEMHDHALHLVDRINKYHAGKGEPTNIRELSALYTTDVIGSAAWGVDAGALASPETSFLRKFGRKLFEFSLRRALETNSSFFAPNIAKYFKFTLFAKECTGPLKSAFVKVMQEREMEMKDGRPTRTGDLVEALIQMKNDPLGDRVDYSLDFLAAQALTFFSAGYETSSTALAFAIYELAFNKEIQEKLFNEVSKVCKGSIKNLTLEATGRMPYLDMCIKESLRKYPPLPFLDRYCMRDYTWTPSDPELKPVKIEKGTQIYIPSYGIHMDPDIHKNPKVYNPERFDPANRRDASIIDYLAFGTGPRNCIGERFGLMQTRFGLAAIALSFKFSPGIDSVPPEKLTIDKKALFFQSEQILNLCFESRT